MHGVAAAASSRLRRRLGALASCVAVLTLGLTLEAAPATRDADVKAAYLFNFSQFVQWPPVAFESASAPFAICVFGDDRLADVLSELVANERVDGHPMTVRSRPPAAEILRCHIAYISGDTPNAGSLLARASGAPVLTVGEDDQFLSTGGVVRLLLDRGRIKFDLNPRAATAVGVTLRSGLLQVARRVEP